MIYFHTEFHLIGSSSSLDIAIKPRTKYGPHAAAMLFTASKRNLNETCTYFKICYCVSFQNLSFSNTTFTPKSQVSVSAILLLSWKLKCGGGLPWRNVYTKFHGNLKAPAGEFGVV
jgi:hypothetical protein